MNPMQGRLFSLSFQRVCRKCKKSKPMKGGTNNGGKQFMCADCKPPKQEAAK